MQQRTGGHDHAVQHHRDNGDDGHHVADSCQLLTAADFEAPLSGTPQPYPDGAETDLIVLVEFADAYARPANSFEMLIGDGHTAASSCATGPDVVKCTTLVAVNATESFKVIAHLRKGKARQAFKRLVTS